MSTANDGPPAGRGTARTMSLVDAEDPFFRTSRRKGRTSSPAMAETTTGHSWAQAHLPPTRAAIIMTMEPVFAALFAVLLGGESATLQMLVGGALVLAAMVLVELGPGRNLDAEVTHIAV